MSEKTQFHNSIHVTFSCMLIIRSLEKKCILSKVAVLCLLLWQYSNAELDVIGI